MGLSNVITRARSWLFDITAHNHAEQLRTQRALVRQRLGVDLEDFPYPGADNSTKTLVQSGGGWLQGALIGASLLAGGIGGTYLFTRANQPQQGTPTVPAQPIATATAQPIQTAPQPPANVQKDGYWSQVKEEQQPDGSWKQVGIIHFRAKGGVVEQLMADGSWQAVPK